MKCPKCNSTNTFHRQETVTFRPKHGIVWWFLIGWWYYMFFAWWIWIFKPKRRKETWKHTVHFCNSCGHKW